MKIFLSVGATYSDTQERFVAAFETFLVQNQCQRLTVGRGSFSARQPIDSARDLMASADAVVVLAFTRLEIKSGTDKPGSKDAKQISDTRYPTVWNQLEAAMAYGLRLPLLVVVEAGMHQEAMLKDRMEFRALTTTLDPGYFDTNEFRGVFADFKRIVEARARTDPKRQRDVASLTIAELARDLRPNQLWSVVAAFVTLMTGLAGAGYWFGAHSVPKEKPPAEQQQPLDR